jgi:hypothetical protein
VQDVALSYLAKIGGRDVYRIEGGVSQSIPAYIEEWVFNDTLSDYSFIVSLAPGTGVTFKALFQSIDVCRADLEVSFPIALTPAISSIRAVSFLAPLSVMIGSSLSWGESEARYVTGGIENDGPLFSEEIYVRLSKLRYVKEPLFPWQEPCYYRIPVSVYIESR